MDQVWTYIISPIAGAIAGGIMTLIFYPQLRKNKDLENKEKEIDNEANLAEEWMKLYQEEHNELLAAHKERDEIVAAKDAKIDTLYEQISQQRDCKANLSKENAALQVENTRLCLLKCEKPNCPHRQPPTGY